jgi:isoleucyl-tRNA synthetase
MGGFYLDLIKDRQYTTAKQSKIRRSCQTAMYHIIRALTLWLAPILSFTAEEIGRYIPGYDQESVFTELWYHGWPKVESVNMDDWEELYLIRDEVNKALEESRQKGEIGSALAAEVTLYAPKNIEPKLTRLGEELRFLLITSGAKVYPMNSAPTELVPTEYGISIAVVPSKYQKCARCWHRCSDIGQNDQYPELCLRCVGNITGQEEIRQFI